MPNLNVEGLPGRPGRQIARDLHDFANAWIARPTVFLGIGESSATTGIPTVVIAGVVTAHRLTVGQLTTWLWEIPQDLDRDRPIDVRAIWSKNDVAVTNVTFLALYTGFARDVAFAAPATAPDTVIAAQAGLATINVVRDGTFGTIGVLDIAAAARVLGVSMEADVLGAAIDDVDLYGIEIRYHRRFI